MNRTGQSNYYESKDLSVATFLYATGVVSLIDTVKVSSKEIYFRFSPKDKADELVRQYWNLQAPPIQPKALMTAMRDIKDLIFAS